METSQKQPLINTGGTKLQSPPSSSATGGGKHALARASKGASVYFEGSPLQNSQQHYRQTSSSAYKRRDVAQIGAAVGNYKFTASP